MTHEAHALKTSRRARVPPGVVHVARRIAEEVLEGLAVLCELADSLVELVSGHLVLGERPAELRLVVNVRNFGDGLASYGYPSYIAIHQMVLKMKYVPLAASSFLGTGEVSFLSSSSREGEMVKKSTPASALISPVYVTIEYVKT